MIKIGNLVRVLYPSYAASLNGIVVAREKRGRWLIRIESNCLKNSQESLLLSLNESDFEVIKG